MIKLTLPCNPAKQAPEIKPSANDLWSTSSPNDPTNPLFSILNSTSNQTTTANRNIPHISPALTFGKWLMTYKPVIAGLMLIVFNYSPISD